MSTPAVLAAKDALGALWGPLDALFEGLHAAYPHLLGHTTGTDRCFALCLSAQGGAWIVPPTQDGWPATNTPHMPYPETARAAGLTGHAIAHLLDLLQRAVQAVRLAAPFSQAVGTLMPPCHPHNADVVFHEGTLWDSVGAHRILFVRQGAFHAELATPKAPEDDVSWRLALLARLSSPGRSYRYMLEDKGTRAWADTAEDAALLLASQERDRSQAEAFLSEPIIFWTHPIELPPAGPLPWQGGDA